MLDPEFGGLLVREGSVLYRSFDGAVHHEAQAILQAGLDLHERGNTGDASEYGPARACGRLIARLARRIQAAPPRDDAGRFAVRLATEFDAVFLFLVDPSVDATQQVLASVARRARQRSLDLLT